MPHGATGHSCAFAALHVGGSGGEHGRDVYELLQMKELLALSVSAFRLDVALNF
jgi:hypothetical protein